MSCEYCKELKSLFWNENSTPENELIKEVYIESDGTITVSSTATLDYVENNPDLATDANFKINYCPMCGRKLKGADNNE